MSYYCNSEAAITLTLSVRDLLCVFKSKIHSRCLQRKPPDKEIRLKLYGGYIIHTKKAESFFIILKTKVLCYVQFSHNYHFIVCSPGKHMYNQGNKEIFTLSYNHYAIALTAGRS